MMNKNDVYLRGQCVDIEKLAPVQFENSLNAFSSLIPDDVLKRVNRIVITGCGDSYLAAMEAKEAFKKYVGRDCKVVAARAIDAARYLPFDPKEPDTMVVAVSASGSPSRVAEVLERGKKHGCVTVALTNKQDSRAAQTAQYAYLTNTPEYPHNSPGLRNYYASLVSLIIMAARIGEIRSGECYIDALREELLSYNSTFFESFPEIDKVCYETASQWVDKKGFEVVADGPLFCCAEFVAAKYAEVSGDKCTVIDSENYCHVNTFILPGEAIGTISMVVSDEENAARLAATVNQQVAKNNRSVLLVCDKTPEEIGVSEKVTLCRIPVPEKSYRFLLLLYAYIPGAVAAAYHSSLIDEPYFRGGGIFFDKHNITLGTNPVRVI